MTGFVLKFTGFVLNMTGYVLDMTALVLKNTEFVLSMNLSCNIGGVYVGVVGYAADLLLLAPTRDAAQQMLKICEQFTEQHQVQYTPGSKEEQEQGHVERHFTGQFRCCCVAAHCPGSREPITLATYCTRMALLASRRSLSFYDEMNESVGLVEVISISLHFKTITEILWNGMARCGKEKRDKAKAISAKLLELNLKNKLE